MNALYIEYLLLNTQNHTYDILLSISDKWLDKSQLFNDKHLSKINLEWTTKKREESPIARSRTPSNLCFTRANHSVHTSQHTDYSSVAVPSDLNSQREKQKEQLSKSPVTCVINTFTKTPLLLVIDQASRLDFPRMNRSRTTKILSFVTLNLWAIQNEPKIITHSNVQKAQAHQSSIKLQHSLSVMKPCFTICCKLKKLWKV